MFSQWGCWYFVIKLGNVILAFSPGQTAPEWEWLSSRKGVGAEAAWTNWGGLKLVLKLGSPRESLQSMQRANIRKAEVLGCSSAIRS